MDTLYKLEVEKSFVGAKIRQQISSTMPVRMPVKKFKECYLYGEIFFINDG